MSSFPKKSFEGRLYEFGHLASTVYQMPLNAQGELTVDLRVTYSIHCFTEEFDTSSHLDHHRYTHNGETRAFCPERYDYSLELPSLVENMARAKVYRAKSDNYTYVARVAVNGCPQPYSIFFSLKDVSSAQSTMVDMYVQSAYLKGLTVGANAKNWRFGSLLGQVTGIFSPSEKKERPKKKAP